MQQLFEAVRFDQLHIFGEHREQATHQELSHTRRFIAVSFEHLREIRQPLGEGARDLRAAARRIEVERIGPDGAEPLLYFFVG